MNTTTETKQNFFNLHTSGIGYLNNIREVQPKKGDAFIAVSIAALTGDANEPEYRYFDCKVCGEEAKKLIIRCEEAVNANKKVLISFKLADLWVDTYVSQKDTKTAKKGDVCFQLKARLIKISSVKVDGELKFSDKQIEA